MNSRDIAYHVRRKKRLQSEKEKEGSKKPKVDWKWSSDSAGTGFKAITRDVTTTEMKHMTFKEYLKETVGGMYLANTSFAKPNIPDSGEDWQDDITDNGTSTGICPKCGGSASVSMTGKTLGSARTFWECENEDCGHQGPKEGY